MKKCVKCQNDLPDSAVHCVFCGTRQPALPVTTSPPGANRTMMGYPGMAADLVKQHRGGPGAPYPTEDPGSGPSSFPPSQPVQTAPPDARTVSPFGATQPVRPEHLMPQPMPYGPPPAAPPYGAPMPSGPSQPMPPQHGMPPQQMPPQQMPPQHGMPPQQQMPPQHGMPPQQQMPYGPPPGSGPPGAVGPTIAPVGMGPGYHPPPGAPAPSGPSGSQIPAPVPTRPPAGMPAPGMPGGPMGGSIAGPVGGMPAAGMPGGPMGGSIAGPVGKPRGADAGPATEQVKPLPPPPKPAHLASEAAGRAANPVEPWAESIKTLMLVFGVLLVACFVAPWKVTEAGTVFSWTALKGGDASAKVIVLLLAGTGVLAVVLGALPLGVISRSITCLLIGFTPLIYLAVVSGFDWRALLTALGGVVLIAGLLVRSQYTRATLARVLVTVGVILIIVPVVAPFSLGAMFSAIGSAPGAAKLAAIAKLVPIVIAVLSLIAWLPGPGKAMSGLFAWILLLWPLVAAVLTLFAAGDIGGAIKGGLDTYFYVPLALVAWLAMAAYGLATLFGKKLEHAA